MMRSYEIALLALATIAQSALANEFDDSPPGSLWSISAGLDVDNDGGYIATGGIAYLPNDQAFFSADIGISDSSTQQTDLESNFASLLADYSFGPVGISASAGWYADDEIADRFRYGGSVYVKGGGFRLGVSAEDWNSEFDTFRFELLTPALIATVDCEIDNTTLGARASYSGDRFSANVSYRDYDYSRPDCSFNIPPNLQIVGDLSALSDFDPMRFQRLALLATAGATRLRLLSADSAFLERSLSAGVSWRHNNNEYGLNYSHTQEVLQKLESDTVYGRILFPAGRSVDLELRLGVSSGDQVDTIAFIGATVFWYLAPGT